MLKEGYATHLFIPLSIYRLLKIKEWVDANDKGATVILMSGALELQLLEAEDAAAREQILKEKETQRSDGINFVVKI